MEEQGQPKNEDPAVKTDSPPEIAPPPPVNTRHQFGQGDAAFAYTVAAGYMKMSDEDGKHKANIFFVAYTRDGEEPGRRPVTFTFNGGPGSSSVWLHLGALGPKRVVFGEDGQAPHPPYAITDNEFSWLEFTDLVFIDPVGTGYSRAARDEKSEQFLGVKEDVNSVGEFIRRYVSQHKRWLSPKFLAGESYGTTRAAGLSGYLHEQGMFLNGVLLISSILQFQTVQEAPGNDMPYIMHLPTYTATAWYHNRLPEAFQADLQKTLDQVRHWAMNDYLLALSKGSQLGDQERGEIATRLASYTGLTREYVLSADIRLGIMRFVKELLRPLGLTVGRLDTRYTGRDRDSAGEGFEYDPSYDAVILGPFTAAINSYLRTDLGFESDLPYETLSIKTHQAWNWGTADKGHPNVSEDLRGSMTRNPALKVFVANGYFDLATPFFATEYTVRHLGLDGDLFGNITMEYYEAGHMMYVQKKSLEKLTADVRGFFSRALPPDNA